MNKISVIIKREYVTRVRKKSFIIMTILAPLLMAAIIIVPTLLMTGQSGEFKRIAVVEDNSDLFKGVIKNTKDAEFVYLENTKVEDIKKTFEKDGYYGILYISPELVNTTKCCLPDRKKTTSDRPCSSILKAPLKRI